MTISDLTLFPNVPFMFPTEIVKGIKMVDVKDIALMKISVSNWSRSS